VRMSAFQIQLVGLCGMSKAVADLLTCSGNPGLGVVVSIPMDEANHPPRPKNRENCLILGGLRAMFGVFCCMWPSEMVKLQGLDEPGASVAKWIS